MKIRRIISTIAAAALAVSLSACSLFNRPKPGNIDEIVLADGDLIAEITIEGYGTVKAKLFPDLAPNAVENFRRLCEEDYYNGLKIHRVAPDSMMQGGSLNGDGTGGTAVLDNKDSFAIETSDKARNFYGALGYANTDGENTTQFYIVNNKTPIDITKYDPAKFTAKADELAAEKANLDSSLPEYKRVSAQETHYRNLATMFKGATDAVKEKYAKTGGYPFWDGGYTVFGQVFDGFDVIDSIAKTELTTNNLGEMTKPVTDIIIASAVVYAYESPSTTEETGTAATSEASSPNAGSAADNSQTQQTDGSAPAQAATESAPAESAQSAESAEPFSTIETADSAA